MKKKQCGRCKVSKETKEFSINRARESGLQDWCRQCYKEHYYSNHKKRKKNLTKYNSTHKDYFKIYNSDPDHKERKRLYMIKYYQDNRECLRLQAKLRYKKKEL